MSHQRKPKYRKGRVKKEHHLLDGISDILDDLGKHPSVKSIIPARIKSAIRGSKAELQVKYETTSGLKLLAKSSGGVQEIFVVTNKPKDVIDYIKCSK